MKTASELQADALVIDGLIDGLDALWDNPESNARNAMLPIMEAAKRAINRLMDDLADMQKPTPPQPTAPKLVDASAANPKSELNEAPQDDVFGKGYQKTYLGHLYNIHSLSIIGVASQETSANVSLAGNASLYEQIARMSAEAIDMAELAERTDKSAA